MKKVDSLLVSPFSRRHPKSKISQAVNINADFESLE
jgi:hypothetical protein